MRKDLGEKKKGERDTKVSMDEHEVRGKSPDQKRSERDCLKRGYLG